MGYIFGQPLKVHTFSKCPLTHFQKKNVALLYTLFNVRGHIFDIVPTFKNTFGHVLPHVCGSKTLEKTKDGLSIGQKPILDR